ncbi:MAG: hypothetical protein Q4B39_07400, partial [[Ruminococcus] gnavus]|nr:hypothetical protein [Mediterraneibacter gnavus]
MCKSLKDYSEYTERVRKYARDVPVEEAVERATFWEDGRVVGRNEGRGELLKEQIQKKLAKGKSIHVIAEELEEEESVIE